MSATRTYYGSFGLEMAEDRYINWPVIYNTLPLFPSEESIRLTYNSFHSMAVKHAVNLRNSLRVERDWVRCGVMLQSRGVGSQCWSISTTRIPTITGSFLLVEGSRS